MWFLVTSKSITHLKELVSCRGVCLGSFSTQRENASFLLCRMCLQSHGHFGVTHPLSRSLQPLMAAWKAHATSHHFHDPALNPTDHAASLSPPLRSMPVHRPATCKPSIARPTRWATSNLVSTRRPIAKQSDSQPLQFRRDGELRRRKRRGAPSLFPVD